MKKGVDYIGVGVGAVIINNEGKLFLAKRGKNVSNEAGTWEFPGGTVEFGEKLRDTIRREIKEEYDVEIEVGELLDVSDHIIPAEKQHWVAPTFLAKIKTGIPRIVEPDKCEAIGWFTIDEVEQMNLSIVSKHDLSVIKKKYPHGIGVYS